MQPLDMVAWFTKEGIPHPVRFKIEVSNSVPAVIKVDHILFRTEEKLAGNRMIIFRCQGIINDTLKIFEIKYELNTCKWFLFKV